MDVDVAIPEAGAEVTAAASKVDGEEEVLMEAVAEVIAAASKMDVVVEVLMETAAEEAFVAALEVVVEVVGSESSGMASLTLTCLQLLLRHLAHTCSRDGKAPPPNAEITKAENATVKDLSTAMGHSSLDFQLPRRPGYGSSGRNIVLWTNYFELRGIKSDTDIHRYSVTFQGNSELPKPKKKRLIQILLKQEPFSQVACASDWAQVLVSTQKVNLGDKRQKYQIEWFPEDGDTLPAKTADEPAQRSDARKRNTFLLLVEQLGTVSLDELVKDLSTSAITYPLKLETIQALNIMMAYGPSTDSRIAVAPQNRFYPFQGHSQFQSVDLGGGLQALRGYFSSVRTSVSRILVNVNVATGAFYKAGPLLGLMRDLGGAPRSPSEYARLSSFVRKLRFETNYIPQTDNNGQIKMGNNGPVTKRKVHTITDLSPFNTHAKNTTFDFTDSTGKSKKITVEEHFVKTYKMKLSTPQAPLVNYSTKDNPKWIPAELCSVLPGQLAKRLLMGDQTREMIAFAARRPADNAESIMNDGLQVTKISPFSQGFNTNLMKFGIKVNPELLTVAARILQPPTLQYRMKPMTPSNGAWNLDVRQLGVKPFSIAKPLGTWNCLVINSGSRDTIPGGLQGTMSLLDQFRQALNTYGLNPGPVEKPALLTVNFADLQNRNISLIQQQIVKALQGGFKQKPNFLFVLLPGDNATLYDCIKFICDVRWGIPNICSIGSKFSKEKGQPQYFANVALKFNQKLGGANHLIKLENLKPLDANTIVFGIDVTHPSPGSSKSSPSIAGIVASVDANFSQYPASIRTQKGREEMVTELEEMILERLKLWARRNSRLPSKVIVYRDGVSEGQYRLVMEKEYPSFVAAFNKLYGAEAKHPKISIIVVGKRHHTRFYPTKAEDADQKTGNPQPGTVVDRGVTGEKLFDFFLLAHQGLQGTSKPGHYVVLKDENRLGADQLQILTHNLCYTFARATRAVSICPPAYYADLLCERGRSYLQGVLKGEGSVAFTQSEWQRDVHANLAETMFYL